MYKSQAEAVRDWLKAYLHNEEEINRQLEDIRELRARMMSIGAQEISDMPRPPSAPKDRMSEYVVKLDSKERALRYSFRVQNECRRALIDIIASLKSEREQFVIRYRYLYGYEWSEIVRLIYKDRKDWAEKMKTYTRSVYRDHERALNHLAECWMPGGRDEKSNVTKENDQ